MGSVPYFQHLERVDPLGFIDRTRPCRVGFPRIEPAWNPTDPSEVEASLRCTTELTGIPNGPLLRAAFDNAERRELTEALAELKAASDTAAAKRLLKSWIAVARADQRIHPAEHDLLQRWTDHLGLTRDYLEGLLDA